MRILIYLLSVLFVFSLFGCATVLDGTSQSLTFESDPEGATVEIDGKDFGETPLSIKVPKNKYSTVYFKKDGYKARAVSITKTFDVATIFSIVLWDLGTTDFISGAAYQYSPDRYYVDLKKIADE